MPRNKQFVFASTRQIPNHIFLLKSLYFDPSIVRCAEYIEQLRRVIILNGSYHRANQVFGFNHNLSNVLFMK